MKNNRVVVTGIGIVSPFGFGKNKWIDALKKNQLIQPVKISDEFNFKAGIITDIKQSARQLNKKLVKFMSDAAMIGGIAGHEAFEEASLVKRYPPERIGICAAVGLTAVTPDMTASVFNHSINTNGEFSEKLFGNTALKQMNPLSSFMILPNMPPCILSVLLNIKGFNLILNPWEDQSAAAISEGFKAIEEEKADAVLVGASDTPSALSAYVFLKQMNYIKGNEFPTSAGAYLVLESMEKALSDHQYIYGELKKISVTPSSKAANDPMSEQIGRTYAAAPPLLLSSLLTGLSFEPEIIGTRGTRIVFSI